MEGNVFPAQIAHSKDVLLLGDPLVIATVVPRLMAAAPAVVRARLKFSRLFGIDIERQDVLGQGMEAAVLIMVRLDTCDRLVPDRLAIGQTSWPRIAET